MSKSNDLIEGLYLWANPDFNEVLIFYGLQAISFRDRKRAKRLYDLIRVQLQRIECENWPYQRSILFAIGISGPTKFYSRRDVDNMCKVILDAGNKIIYNDDRLISILIVQKQLWKLPQYGFQLGIRVVDSEKKDEYTPILYFASYTKPDIAESKNKSPIIFRFENEN